MPAEQQPMLEALLVLPRLRVQNANAVSSPLTWGFPSMTAFIGFMHALERRLRDSTGLQFWRVGVVCHHFEAQATQTTPGVFTRSFHLTRNPVDKDGGTAAIVEEGRVHLEVTLVFEVRVPADQQSQDQRQLLADTVAAEAAAMRLAGGSVMPPVSGMGAVGGGATGVTSRRRFRPYLELLDDNPEQGRKAFRRLSRRWLPGFALVSRDDLLQERLLTLRKADAKASVLDAWLSLSRLTHRASKVQKPNEKTGETIEVVEWTTERAKGWVVPIPVGYTALSPLHAAGTVAHSRDATTPFAFVESVYSMGQWISPHRLATAHDMLWQTEHDPTQGLYRCVNAFRPTAPSAATPIAPAGAAAQTL
jgi:CRISPR-associated protein Csy2